MIGRASRALLILAALALGPFVVLVTNSVRPSGKFLSASAGFLPSQATFEHYAKIFDPGEGTLRYLVNSLIITTATTILAHVSITVPFVVWMLLGFFEELPREIELSAMLDGCGPVRRFVQIVLPLTAPALGAAAVLTAFLSWNEFLMASTVAPNAAKTLPVRVSGFITDKGILWGNMSAMGTVIVAPVVIFALFTQRYLARGLTVGAVKG